MYAQATNDINCQSYSHNFDFILITVMIGQYTASCSWFDSAAF